MGYKIAPNQVNRGISKHIRSLVDSLFTLKTNQDYTAALFEPDKWFITMPFVCVQLLNLSRTRQTTINEYSGIRIQIGYTNTIVLSYYRYPTPPKKVWFKSIDLTEIPLQFTPIQAKRYKELFRLK